jgi:hypothetical protein
VVITALASVFGIPLVVYLVLAAFERFSANFSRYSWRRRFVWRWLHWWSVVRLRRRFIGLTILAWVLASVIESFYARRFYGATARMEIAPEPPNVMPIVGPALDEK